MFRRKFWVSLALTVPTVVYSAMVQDWLGYTAPRSAAAPFVAPLFGTLVFAWGGPVFLRGGWDELRARRPGMMLLISMGLLVAFGASVATEFGWIDVDLWFELATLVTIMLLGHWLEMRAIGQAQGALAALAALLPDEAERVADDDVEIGPLDELRVGDVVLVRPGGRVPADGVDRRRRSRGRRIDDHRRVPAGRRTASATGSSPAPSRPTRPSACGSRGRRRHRARRHPTARRGSAGVALARAGARRPVRAACLFYVAAASRRCHVHGVDCCSATSTHAVERTVTVLVIACPHALGLAIPLTIAVSTASSRARRHPREGPPRARADAHHRRGAVRQDRHAHDRPARRDRTSPSAGVDRRRACWRSPAAVEADSEHPLARAVVAAAAANVRSRPDRDRVPVDRRARRRGDRRRRTVAVGGPALLRERG